jgi:hypothetical protein
MCQQVISQRQSLKSQSVLMPENGMLCFWVQLVPVSLQQRHG